MSGAMEKAPVAIVTGGGGALGLAIAEALLGAGFTVAVTGRSERAKVAPVLADALAKAGGRLHYFKHDTTDNPAHPAFVQSVIDTCGGLHCLVNNVGLVARPRVDVLDLVPQQLDAMYEVNLRGAFFLSQAVARALLALPDDGRYRSLINITSIAAEILNDGLAHYCASKAALSTITQSLALRLARENIMVHEVRPGFLWGPGQERPDVSPLDDWIERGGLPMRRRGAVAEVAQTVASLAAGQLRYMTGQPIWVAGGANLRTAF